MDTPVALLFKNARLRLGVSQAELAMRIGAFGQTFVTLIETGKGTPDPKHAEAISKALNVSEDAVLDAIMATKFPDLQISTGKKIKRNGFFVELTPIEERRATVFAETHGWPSPGAMLRKVLLQFLDAQEGKK